MPSGLGGSRAGPPGVLIPERIGVATPETGSCPRAEQRPEGCDPLKR